ncbi:MAG: DUF1850 domain-containing protein [Clostridiales bacterium]|jgi:hypothetical protein|nr:DUF1850 domain-containing protein [Clostridiales bacterium]
MKKKHWGWSVKPPPPVFFVIILIALFTTGTYMVSAKNNRCEILMLTVSSPSGERTIRLPVEEGEEFVLRYTHSAELLPVSEIYHVETDGGFVLREYWLQSFGAGLGDWQGDLVFENGQQKVKNIDAHFTELPLRVGRIAAHTLVLRGLEYPLRDVFEGGELVIITIKKTSSGEEVKK